ncbi:MAG TPA: hypothetical protein VN027_16450 [Isoptericola sp.]|nr:hypothetical protein [Isoptericola sp.]
MASGDQASGKLLPMSAEEVNPPAGKEVRASWPSSTMEDAQVVNQFAISNDVPTMTGAVDGGIYLTFGHVSQPVLTDERAVREFLADTRPVELDIRKLGTFYLSNRRARDLVEVLHRHLEAQEALPTATPLQ